MGLGRAGFGCLMEELLVPKITNSRTRFSFTLLGWHPFGRHSAPRESRTRIT
jgi:hypothetical protein